MPTNSAMSLLAPPRSANQDGTLNMEILQSSEAFKLTEGKLEFSCVGGIV
jgi:hypothetical protein